MSGAEAIAAERQRQVEAEGWTPEHDDEYADGELVAAAECYLAAARIASGAERSLESVRRVLEHHGADPEQDRMYQQMRENSPREFYGWDEAPSGGMGPNWPWDVSWWKPTPDVEGNLVKAGALIAAELDRLARSRQP